MRYISSKNTFGASVTMLSDLTVNGNVTISNTSPTLTMTDTTTSAKSLTQKTDANYTYFYESAGAAGDILTLDLTNKRVGIGSGAAAPGYALDVADGNISVVIGAVNGSTARTNAVAKNARIGAYSYNNAASPTLMLRAITAGGYSNLYVGGGDSVMSAATYIHFYTASSIETATGTNRGSIYPSGNWSIGNIPITTPKLLSVWGGDQTIIDPTDLGSESLNEGNFATHAKWDATGDFTDDTGAGVYTHSAGSGTLTQTSANLAVAGVGNRYYKFVYTISGVTAGCTVTITTAFASASTALAIGAGTQTSYFKSAASPTNFVISVTSTAGGFTIDDVSLKEVQGGDITVNGLITGGGTSGIKVLGSGSVGIGTTSPTYPLDVSGSVTAIRALTNNANGQALALNGATGSRTWSFVPVGTGGTVGPVGGLVIYDGSAGQSRIVINTSGLVGILTTAPDKALEINHATGLNLRLTYNDSNGSAANYADFETTSGGNLTITPSGGIVTMGGKTVFNKPAVRTITTLTFGESVAVDASVGDVFKITCSGGDATFTIANPTNPTDGQVITFWIKQPASGAAEVVTWGTKYTFCDDIPNGTLSTTNLDLDRISFVYSSTTDTWDVLAFVKGR